MNRLSEFKRKKLQRLAGAQISPPRFPTQSADWGSGARKFSAKSCSAWQAARKFHDFTASSMTSHHENRVRRPIAAYKVLRFRSFCFRDSQVKATEAKRPDLTQRPSRPVGVQRVEAEGPTHHRPAGPARHRAGPAPRRPRRVRLGEVSLYFPCWWF